MNKNEIMTKMGRTFHRTGLKLKKHSPEILLVVGVVGTVASTVMACKATTKVGDILEDTKTQVDKVHTAIEHPELCKEEYTVEDSKKDLAIIYTQTGIQLAKLYAPAIVLGALSLTSILASHNIIRKRNIALAAAYTTLDKSFKEYRGRVIERFGEALDRELKYNIKTKEIEETVIDENGNEQTVTKSVEVADPNQYSQFARFYDETCAGWERDSEYNLMTLNHKQNYANDILKTRGHLFLNEVYDMLGIPRSKAGNIVGWVYDEKNPVGDNFVDFGIYNIYSEKARDFVNGYEKSILLDFNVDGNVLDLID